MPDESSASEVMQAIVDAVERALEGGIPVAVATVIVEEARQRAGRGVARAVHVHHGVEVRIGQWSRAPRALLQSGRGEARRRFTDRSPVGTGASGETSAFDTLKCEASEAS